MSTVPAVTASSVPGTMPVDYVSFNEPLGAPIPDLVADGFADVRTLPKTAQLVGTSFALRLSEVAASTTIPQAAARFGHRQGT